MNGIYVVIFLVGCTSDLLLCESMETDYLRFTTMDSCREQASALIAEARSTGDARTWMAKCHYLLPRPDSGQNEEQLETASLPEVLAREGPK